MRVLVVDSHKGSTSAPSSNLHWKNARAIADLMRGDLIWSYPSVNDRVSGGYDAIVFVHASHYAYTDYAWLEASPDAKLFYVVNEYNLGEPRTLWMAAKNGRKYEVIANHPSQPSKIVMKYVTKWNIVNLNAISYSHRQNQGGGGLFKERSGCVYYGGFRKDRAKYFRQWLRGDVVVSTHPKNRAKFESSGVSGPFCGRLDIESGGLSSFMSSLYIEDETTHTHYNFLANRFYESLSWGTCPLFADSCTNTIALSGYEGAKILSSPDEIPSASKGSTIPAGWHEKASAEKTAALDSIAAIIGGH